MKQWMCLMLSAALVMSLAACSPAQGGESIPGSTAATYGSTPQSKPSEPEASTPTTEETEPTQGQTTPSTSVTEPSVPATTPSEPTTVPSNPATQPTEPEAVPTEPMTEPTEPATKPTEPATKPTEPATKPTEPATKPTEPATQPTEPATKPTEPATKPTEPATKPTEPATEPTEPATKPTEPATEPTEPATEPTEPATKPTEHTHRYTAAVTKEASCAEAGLKTYTCSCGDEYSETIPMTAHRYTEQVTAPTCDQQGYTTHTCQCGNSYVDSVTEPLGHYYVTSETKATCVAAGSKTETCKNCGDSRVVATYPATGHQHTKTESVEATCSTNGYTRTMCTDCNTVISEKETPATGCTYSKTMNAAEASEILLKKYEDMGVDHYSDKFNNCLNIDDASEWLVDVCPTCGEIDYSSLRWMYTPLEAAEIMAGYINELRFELYGTHDYDVKVCVPLMEIAAVRAKELTVDYSHSTITKLYGASENISFSVWYDTIYSYYYDWFKSPAHYALMINKTKEYIAFAIDYNEPIYANGEVSYTANSYGSQLFWDWREYYDYCMLHGLPLE